jgi:hypothetical protein
MEEEKGKEKEVPQQLGDFIKEKLRNLLVFANELLIPIFERSLLAQEYPELFKSFVENIEKNKDKITNGKAEDHCMLIKKTLPLFGAAPFDLENEKEREMALTRFRKVISQLSQIVVPGLLTADAGPLKNLQTTELPKLGELVRELVLDLLGNLEDQHIERLVMYFNCFVEVLTQ